MTIFLIRLILQIKSKHLFVLINFTYKTYILNYGGLIAIFTSKEPGGGGRAPTKLARGGDMSLAPPLATPLTERQERQKDKKDRKTES